MKGIMITAPGSGSGKTTVTLGLLRALKDISVDVCAFKTGPDFIDTAFLAAASGKEAGNLDLHMQGNRGMRQALSMGSGTHCVIEGVMGYFDGIYNTYENSSYDISKALGVNAVLVYAPAGEMFTAVTKIMGMKEFPGSRIKAVILNRTSKKIYDMMAPQIEAYTGLPVLGYLPEESGIQLESRHLGLIQSVELGDREDKIQAAADLIRTHIDLDRLMDLMCELTVEAVNDLPTSALTVAIPRDKAFSFYYRENLRLLESCCTVRYFSPLQDAALPECDLLYIGGGYPEVFREELFQNTAMITSIRSHAQKGGTIYAECGGLMYLMDTIDGTPATGVLHGCSEMTGSLNRFGYVTIVLERDCMLGKAGDKITAQEFHRSRVDSFEETVYQVTHTYSGKQWKCGYARQNVLAGYPHINFIGNLDAFQHMLNWAEKGVKEE